MIGFDDFIGALNRTESIGAWNMASVAAIYFPDVEVSLKCFICLASRSHSILVFA